MILIHVLTSKFRLYKLVRHFHFGIFAPLLCVMWRSKFIFKGIMRIKNLHFWLLRLFLSIKRGQIRVRVPRDLGCSSKLFVITCVNDPCFIWFGGWSHPSPYLCEVCVEHGHADGLSDLPSFSSNVHVEFDRTSLTLLFYMQVVDGQWINEWHGLFTCVHEMHVCLHVCNLQSWN